MHLNLWPDDEIKGRDDEIKGRNAKVMAVHTVVLDYIATLVIGCGFPRSNHGYKLSIQLR
jgi:hypothetical protein